MRPSADAQWQLNVCCSQVVLVGAQLLKARPPNLPPNIQSKPLSAGLRKPNENSSVFKLILGDDSRTFIVGSGFVTFLSTAEDGMCGHSRTQRFPFREVCSKCT